MMSECVVHLIKSYTHFQMNTLKLTKKAGIGSGTSRQFKANQLLPQNPELQHISIIKSVGDSVVVKSETNPFYLNEPLVVEVCKTGQQFSVKLAQGSDIVFAIDMDDSVIQLPKNLWVRTLLQVTSITSIEHDFSAKLVGSNCFIKDNHREGWLSPAQEVLQADLYLLEDTHFSTQIATMNGNGLMKVATHDSVFCESDQTCDVQNRRKKVRA